MDLKIPDIRELDPKNVGNWPVVPKVAAVVLLCAVVLVLGYLLHVKSLLDSLDAARNQEQALRQEFEKKQSMSASLSVYKQQMNDMQESFGTMLRQLPSRNEVADLLVDITQTGLASGLSFELFKPESEVPQEFYAELPISLKVSGTYHSFGSFASGVASLPRIVTLHDISITRIEGPAGKAEASGKGKGGEAKNSASRTSLILEAKAKTYRYLDEEEIAAVQAKEKEKAKGKGKVKPKPKEKEANG